jgi:chemotaxis protein methyltransferase CheR
MELTLYDKVPKVIMNPNSLRCHLVKEDFFLLQKLLLDQTGVELSETRREQVCSLLLPIFEKYKCHTVAELIRQLEQNDRSQFPTELIDLLSVNETHFFRDVDAFTLLAEKLLPESKQRREKSLFPHRPIHIWSAGCSTGQEAYSIAMLCSDLYGANSDKEVSLVASDLSEANIQRCRKGVYSRFELQRDLSDEQISKYFRQIDEEWVIDSNVRNQIKFAPLNLVDSEKMSQYFDIIFCRYVGIYLPEPSRTKMFQSLVERLLPGGSLLIGSTETLPCSIKKMKHTHYRSIYYYTKNG